MRVGRQSRPTKGAEPASRAEWRRFRRRRSMRRWVVWRRVLVGVLVVVLGASGVWVVYGSDLLTVEKVRVRGTQLLSPQRVRSMASVPENEQLVVVDTEAVERRVEALAPVRDAEVHRAWPDTVEIVVHEREAIAVVSVAGQLWGMDAAGVLFREYTEPPDDLPRVKMPQGTSDAAMEEAAQVIQALPADLARRVQYLTVETRDQISLVLRDGRTIVWGSAEDSALKARVAETLLEAWQAEIYNVSVPGMPTTYG